MDSDFSTGKVWKQILAQALPLTVAEIVLLLYNIVDRIYLGHLSRIDSLALTGVGLVFPLISVIAAFTSLISSGGAPLFAIARGARDEERASRLQGASFTLLLSFSLGLTLACYAFRKPVLFLFGASEASYACADSYLRIYLIGTPMTMLATGMSPFINAQGAPRYAMLATLLGAAVNIVLDPLMIFALGMGVRGAALASVIGQTAALAVALPFFLGKRALLPLRRDHLRPTARLFGEIVSLGVVGFIMKATNALVQAACNSTLQLYGGDLYVAAMTVVNSVRDILCLPVMGITDGARPVMGYNYGARLPERVRQGIRFTTAASLGYTFAAWILVLALPTAFVRLFTRDPGLLAIGPSVLKLYFFGFFFQAFQFAGKSVFQALGDARHAVFFSLLRKAVIVFPLTLLLPRAGLGIRGVFAAEPISNAIGGLACYITMFLTVYRKLGR